MGLDWLIDDPCEAIDAPTLDNKDRAMEIWDEWGRDTFTFDTFKEFWSEMEGSQDCERCRVWRAYDAGGRGGSFATNPCAFRGKRLQYVEDYPNLQREVDLKRDRSPSEMKELIEELEPYSDAEAVQHAINWLKFWSDVGGSMVAWY